MMLTMLDFAKLAFYAYKDRPAIKRYMPAFVFNKPIKKDEFECKTLSNGTYEVMVDNLTQSLSSLRHPFYASFFVKVHNHKATGAVIAIRGTEPKLYDNVKQDVSSWWKSFFKDDASVELPKAYIMQALGFYGKVRWFLQEHLDLPLTKVFVTGHSLGGAIAALMPAYHGLPICAVTFNAPGIQHVSKVRNVVHRIINIRATYDFVSALGTAIGPRINIPVPEKAEAAAKAFEIAREHKTNGWSRFDLLDDLAETKYFTDSALAQHSMANLLQSIKHNQGDKHIAFMTYQQVELSLAALAPSSLETA